MFSTSKINKMKQTKKTTKKIDEKALAEKMDILSKADKIKGEQLIITPANELEYKKEIENFALGDIDNPEKKYDVYYKGIQKLLRKHLPAGKANKKARGYIYEEKNVYLTRGKRINKIGIRGHDSRHTYLPDAEEVLKVIIEWVTRNGTSFELYNILLDMNIKKKYGKPIIR
jgi:hypothetical protein